MITDRAWEDDWYALKAAIQMIQEQSAFDGTPRWITDVPLFLSL